MKKSLRAGVSFQDYSIDHYAEPVEIVALAALETLWVEVVESALTDPQQPLNRIKDLYRLLTAKITVLCSGVIHSNGGTGAGGGVAAAAEEFADETQGS